LQNFTEYIKKHYNNAIWKAASAHIEGNPSQLELRSNLVDIPDEAELSDINIQFVNVRDAESTGIEFVVVVEAEIEIAKTVCGNRKVDGVLQWFDISCTADLDNGLHRFSVREISVYSKIKQKNQAELSNELVPIISTNQLDCEAEIFLEKYYPEALSTPTPVDVFAVVERMGLTLREEKLSGDSTIFGQIRFAEKTILYDPDVFFMRSLGSVRNTIIHECVHWEKHKKAFELQRLLNEHTTTLSCRVAMEKKPKHKWTSADHMEWQANRIAPKILMPFKQTHIKVENLIQAHTLLMGSDKISDVIESVIKELAEFFDISKQAAKIRMIDLGYEEAAGALTFLDGRYIATHVWEKGALQKNQTFAIRAQDAIIQYATNLNLRQMVDAGKYVYADARYCINDPKYVRVGDNGRAELTDYANTHADECCLVFDLESKPNIGKDNSDFYTECILYRDGKAASSVEARYVHSEQNQAVDARADGLCLGSIQATNEILCSLPSTFGETLKTHMDRLGLTLEKLGERSLLHSKTIQRMRNNMEHDADIKSLVAICIGLQLNSILSMDLIRKSGRSFVPTNEHIAYQFLLAHYYQNSIYDCNEELRKMGLPPIGREQ